MNDARVEYVARDPASRRVLELAHKVAVTPATVLLTGESGCGKDQLVRLIHDLSERRHAPCLKIDCASLPPELVESELFGHEKGAFTGAVERKRGRFELAGNGSLVLDEVAALAPAVQAKLLRVLEERGFERLGGNETLKMQARLMALTNADLQHAVASGRFREDLFFRLNVLTIAIPPLRERRGDILPLAEHLLARLSAVHGRRGAKLDDTARAALERYAWPGNVRELKNAIERALVVAPGTSLRAEDLPEHVRAAGAAARASAVGMRSLEEIEKEAIAATLEATRYQISKSAEILGISRKSLFEKRKRYGLK